jgi:hypothetical protein
MSKDSKWLDGVERIRTLALVEADVLSRKGLSRSERVARKAKIEAYGDALDALTDALLGVER